MRRSTICVRAAKAKGLQQLVIVIGAILGAGVQAAEDIEFVQEHLPEVAMDNRYATLPLWSSSALAERGHSGTFQSAFSSTSAGSLTLDGPLLSLGTQWRWNEHWDGGLLGFYDPLGFAGGTEHRDLETLFAPQTPIDRPVAAEFSGLDGTAVDLGAGAYLAWRSDSGFLGAHRWIGGLLWQRMSLHDYRFNYRIVSGPQAGMRGTIDFDADYAHVVPFAALELPRQYGRWTTNAHALLAVPLPRRGIVGHITGPGFDIRSSTDAVGNGKHFGDPSVTFGYSLCYEPAHVSVDVGALLTQGLLEPKIHRGIDRDVLLSFSMQW